MDQLLLKDSLYEGRGRLWPVCFIKGRWKRETMLVGKESNVR
jgi:hypothetical protein